VKKNKPPVIQVGIFILQTTGYTGCGHLASHWLFVVVFSSQTTGYYGESGIHRG